MAAKRSSLFGEAAPKGADETSPTSQAIARDLPQVAAGASEPAPAGRYPKAKTREGKRVATVYLEREALRQLQRSSSRRRLPFRPCSPRASTPFSSAEVYRALPDHTRWQACMPTGLHACQLYRRLSKQR